MRFSLMSARALFNGSMGKSTLLKNSAMSGYCFWNGADTPIDSFEASERVGFGLGLSASVRVFQA